MLALHILNRTDSADLVRSFWTLGHTAPNVVSLVRGAYELLTPLSAGDRNPRGSWMTPMTAFLVGLYKYARTNVILC